MRERTDREESRPIVIPSTLKEKWTIDDQGNKDVYYSRYSTQRTHMSSVRERIMHDVVTKEFNKLSSRGKIVNNPMDSSDTTEITGVTRYKWDWETEDRDGNVTMGGDSYSNLYGSFDRSKCNISIDRDALISQAISSAHANCDLSEAAILASLGEFRETVAGLAAILIRVYRIYRKIRKLDLYALRKEIKPAELADRYMEYRYALRPLYYDAVQLTSAYNKAMPPKGSRKTFRSFKEGSDTDTGTYVTYGYRSDGKINMKFTTDYYIHEEVCVRAGVLCQITNDSRLLSFGAANIPQSMWELVPFSFIIDWFWNVGDIISSFSPKVGLNELASWAVVTTSTSVTSSVTVEGVDHTNSDNVSWTRCYADGNTTANYELYSVKKERLVNPPRGFLPRVDINLDALKLLDLQIIVNKLRK